MTPPSFRAKPKQTKYEAAATLIGGLVLVPILVTLFWNYGATEVIQALGGPDANVNLLAGWLATYFLAGVPRIMRQGLAE